jgi:preprotein translocase subunit SecB
VKLEINFSPSGQYDPHTGIFKLAAGITCMLEKATVEVAKFALEADFRFAEPIPFIEMPTYFYVNSLAIFFPYVRAFLSTMTLQANCGLMQIPVMNLSSLQSKLRERSKEVTTH